MKNRGSKTYAFFSPLAESVPGPPFDDPKGRLRKGGGINVSIN